MARSESGRTIRPDIRHAKYPVHHYSLDSEIVNRQLHTNKAVPTSILFPLTVTYTFSANNQIVAYSEVKSIRRQTCCVG